MSSRARTLLCHVFWLGVACGASVLLANDPSITYTGRFNMENPLSPSYTWAATQISCTFTGTTLSGNFSAPEDGERLRIIIDGHTHGFVVITGKSVSINGDSRPKKWSEHVLAKGLSNGQHTATVWKVTEDNTRKNSKGVAAFGGFSTDGTFAMLHTTSINTPTRRLEFIGDSDTAGWCADGGPHTDDDANTYQDASVTWAAQLAQAFGAELHVQAVSGWGVGAGAKAIQQVLDYTNGFAKTQKWNYSQWTPDAVVMLIGPNDESLQPRFHPGSRIISDAAAWLSTRESHVENVTHFPASRSVTRYDGKQFVKDYLQLMNIVSHNYQHARVKPKIIHVCGGSLNGFDPCDDIQTANREFNKHHSGDGFTGHYTTIKKETWERINGCEKGMKKCNGKSEWNGCDGHYNAKGHQALLEDIKDQFAEVMGWKY